MAVQEIEKREAAGSVGIKKSINNAAQGLVMDIVQDQQYQKPIPSTVRELTANAVDSQSEKDRAFDIIMEGIDPSNYFIERNEDLYKDSNWDETYYNLEHLNRENQHVELIYKEGEGMGRVDKFIVKDHGVGIGKRRLQGVLEIGYSTKRNRKDALGAFGLGAKVGLSTGADYYNMTTVYNGVKYKLKIFSKKVNSLIGKFNLETNEENVPYNFYEDNDESKEIVGTIYGEKTDEKNYTQIEIPCLKHHRSDFDLAVETQLLFFDNVKYYHESLEGSRNEIHFKAEVLYNSDNLIVAKNTPYSKPFVVIVNGNQAVGVCYGHVDFKELELQDMRGAIGIKCNIRQAYEKQDGTEEVITPGVDVIASREAIRWTTNTREYLTDKFESAQDEATAIIEKELAVDDFLEWLDACKGLQSYGNTNPVLSKLSSIVDFRILKPKFKGSNVKFSFNVDVLFPHFTVKHCTKYEDKEDNKFKVKRETLEHTTSINFNALLPMSGEEGQNRTKDVYLCDKHGGSFTTIKAKKIAQIGDYQKLINDGKLTREAAKKIIAKETKKQSEIINLIKASENFKLYDDIEVPADYKTSLDRIEEKLEENAEANRVVSAKERRELEGKIVCHKYVNRYFSYPSQYDETYSRQKVEPTYEEIKDYKYDLYYGFQKDDSLLQYAQHILSTSHKDYDEGDTCISPIIRSIAKNNHKHFKNHKHINDFFGTYENNTIKMNDHIIRWNTARIIKERQGNLLFFRNFKVFNEEMYDLWKEITDYSDSYQLLEKYSTRRGLEHHEPFVDMLDKMADLQKFMEDDFTKEDLMDKIDSLNSHENIDVSKDVKGVLVVDTEMLDKLDKLLTYAKPIRTLLNEVSILTLAGSYSHYQISNPPTIDLELQMSIKSFLKFKLNN